MTFPSSVLRIFGTFGFEQTGPILASRGKFRKKVEKNLEIFRKGRWPLYAQKIELINL